MFNIENVNRPIEMFVFDIYVASIKIKEVIIELINNIEENLKIGLIEAYTEDNHYLNFVINKLESLK